MIKALGYGLFTAALFCAPVLAQDNSAAVPPPAETVPPADAAPAAPPVETPAPQPAPEQAAPPAPEQAAPLAAPASASAVAAAPKVVEGTLGTPPPEGKGQVVFFRPSRFMGAALSFTVREGDSLIAKLGNGRYFVDVVDPGPHTFRVVGEVTDKLDMEIDPGETYYVEQTIGVGLVLGRPNLSPSDEQTFNALKGMKPAKMAEPAKK